LTKEVNVLIAVRNKTLLNKTNWLIPNKDNLPLVIFNYFQIRTVYYLISFIAILMCWNNT